MKSGKQKFWFWEYSVGTEMQGSLQQLQILTVHLIVKLVFVLPPRWGWLGVDGTEHGMSQVTSGENSPSSSSFFACNL